MRSTREICLQVYGVAHKFNRKELGCDIQSPSKPLAIDAHRAGQFIEFCMKLTHKFPTYEGDIQERTPTRTASTQAKAYSEDSHPPCVLPPLCCPCRPFLLLLWPSSCSSAPPPSPPSPSSYAPASAAQHHAAPCTAATCV